MRIVPALRLILDGHGVDRNTPLLLLRSVIDLTVISKVGQRRIPVVQTFGNGRSQGSFSVVDVADGPDVDVGLVALEDRFEQRSGGRKAASLSQAGGYQNGQLFVDLVQQEHGGSETWSGG